MLGQIDQNNVASTIRGTEVLADPTAALALEAAVRRRANPAETVRLCAVCRVLRLQPVPDVPGFTQHFALFALVTAGARNPPTASRSRRCASTSPSTARCWTPAGSRSTSCGSRTSPPHVLEAMKARSRTPTEHAPVATTTGRCSTSPPPTARARTLGLADGGLTDWTQRLLSNRKERLFTSGLGLGLLAQRFT